jgi:hypothetical protein
VVKSGMTQKRRSPGTQKPAGRTKGAKLGSVTLGRDLMAAINAVEGLHLTEEMKRDLEEFDRKGLSHEERRRFVIAKYGKPG